MNFARKIFFEPRIFLRKMLRNFPRNFWAFVLWVRKNPRKIPSKSPTKFQKSPRAHKNKIGTPPPPPKTPPKKGEFYGHGFSCRKNAFFPGVHKIGAPISGPRIADTNFTDTRIFPAKFSKFPCEKSKKNSPTSFCRSAERTIFEQTDRS